MQDMFDEVINRRGTDSIKWDFSSQALGYDDLLPMWVADMDFRAPDVITAALRQRAEHGIFGYTGRGEAYCDAIVRWFARRHQWQIKPEWIAHMPGVVSALRTAVECFSEPNDGIIVQPPVYHPFYRVVERAGRRVVKNPLLYDGQRYSIDFPHLEHKLAQGAAMIILCSPHNPGGRVWTVDELQQLLTLAERYDAVVLADEIWADLVLPGHRFTPAALAEPRFAARVISCAAPSKTFNLAGLNTAAVIIPDRKRADSFRAAAENFEYGAGNVFGMTALQAAFDGGETWLDGVIAYVAENMEWGQQYLARTHPQVRWVPQEATYLAWLDLNALGADDDRLRRAFYEKARVGVLLGSKFGPEGQGFVRVNMASPRSVIAEGFQRICTALDSLGSSR